MYGGTKEEMQRLLADAQKLTGVKYDITNLNDVFQAIHVIQQELGITGTTAKEAEETITGSVSSMKAAWDNFLNGSGTFDQFVESAKTAFNNIAKAVAELLPRIAKEIAGAIPEEFIEKVKEILPYIEAVGIAFLSWKVGTTIQSIVLGFQKAQVALSLYSLQANGASIAQGLFNGTLTIGETLVGLFTGKVTLAQIASAGLAKAQAVLNAVMAANPIALVVLAIGALIAIFVVLWNKCDWFRNFWISLWENAKSVLGQAKDFIVEKLEEIGEFFSNIGNSIVSFFTETIPNAWNNFITSIQELVNTIFTVLQNGWNSIIVFFTEGIPNFISSIIEWISQLPGKIGYQFGLIIGNIIQFGIDTWNWITTELPLIIEGIVIFFSELPGKIWEFLLDIINKIIDWGTQCFNNAVLFTTNLINSVVMFFSELPGKIWNFLTDIISKIINWGQQSFENAKNFTRNLVDTVTQFFSELPGKIWEFLSDIINKIITWGTDMVNKGKEAATNLVNTIHTTLSELPGKVMEIGGNIVQGLWNGIQNASGWIRSKVEEFAQGILQGMKDALRIHSPSGAFRDEVGKFIPQGVAVGIEADTDKALQAIRNMDDEIMQEMHKAVAFETGSINARATLNVNKEQPLIIEKDHITNIDNKQYFDSKNQTPYEEQKQAKQQLRRLAYEL